MLQEDLLYELAGALHNLPFEARKDTQTIFSHILRFKPPQASSPDPPVVSYIVHNRPEIIIELCRGYEHSQSAMPCGTILREALKFDVIAAIILYDQSKEGEPAIRLTEVQPATPQRGTGIFWRFFHWIDRGSFELT
jgi:calcium binding protein 39